MTAVAKLPTVDELAQEIRRVDGNHSLGAGALAEALMPFLAALSPAELGGVGADFDKWYGSCDARLWNNWDACKAAYIAGQKSKAKLDGVPPIREGENIHSYGARCFESGYAQASMLALSAAPAGVSEWQRWSVIADGTGGVEEFKNVCGRWVKYSDVASTPRAAEAVTEEWTSELAEVIQTQTGCGDSDAVRAAAASIANINDWLALNPYPRAAVVTEASKAQSAWRRRRLGEIQRIIEAVDDRAMANDDEVPTTMQEMTQAEMSRIYDLSRGVNCGELEALTPPSAKGENSNV